MKTMFDRVNDAFPRMFGKLLGIYALVALLFSAIPIIRHELNWLRLALDILILPVPYRSVPWAVFLFILSGALLARKRLGWLFAFIMLFAVNIDNLAILLDPQTYAPELSPGMWALYITGFVVQFVLLVLLLVTRKQFPARTWPASLFTALMALVVGLTLVTALGYVLVNLFPHTLVRGDRLLWVVNRTVLLGLVDPVYFTGHPAHFIEVLLSIVTSVVVLLAVVLLFRSQQSINSLTSKDEVALRSMIARWGQDDSLAYFATRHDKSVIFASDGRAAITYRVQLGVCIASGDPIGDPAAWDDTIDQWLRMCSDYGWAPAVMGASSRGARAFARRKLAVIHLGDEAVIDTDQFVLTGPDQRAVRQAVSRARNAGVTVRIRRHNELTEEELAEVERDANAWRDTTDERGFSMALSRIGHPADGECLLVEALMPTPTDGEVPTAADSADAPQLQRVALLSFVPWGRNGISLDLMRRSRQAPNGTNETMVAELCAQADEVGISRISLNFAVFRRAFEQGEQLGASPVSRGWRALLVFLSRWWQLEALYRSNDKYHPQWSPRYLCYRDNFSLARVGVVAGIVEGFIPFVGRRATVPSKAVGQYSSAGARAAYERADELFAAADQAVVPQRRRPQQVEVRLARAKELQSRGIDPWPTAVVPTATCAEVESAASDTELTVAGRIMARRDFGGVMFLVVQDWSGQCQVVVERDRCEDLTYWRKDLDLADLIRVTGVRGQSRTGHPSLLATEVALEAKALHPLPDKQGGLRDPEARIRSRHVDLTVNQDARDNLRARAAVLHSLRAGLHEHGYIEAETPILQQIHGGANARPFRTHINAYNLDLYLRIAPELYLKRLVCGGVDRVFELGREFRNEGVDATHNPEFTSLEAYAAHGDYRTMLTLTQELIQQAAIAVRGECSVLDPQGQAVDISGDWPVKTVLGAISEGARDDGLWDGPDLTTDTPREELQQLCARAGLHCKASDDVGTLIEELYEYFAESRATTPTFFCDFPVATSPLTRRHRDNPELTERWDLVAWGVELGTAYSELTDPIDQRQRLESQSLLAAGGDPEAMEVDEDFLRALEFGMPPTGGLGLGVDRLVMMITGATIRQSLAFPLVKPGQ